MDDSRNRGRGRTYNTRQRHSHPNVETYEVPEAKKQKTIKRTEPGDDDSNTFSTDSTHPVSNAKECCPSSNSVYPCCTQCNALVQGLNSPLGALFQGEIFRKGIRHMQDGNTCTYGYSPQQGTSWQSTFSKKDHNYCDSCHHSLVEMRSPRDAYGQFCVTGMSRTSNQATDESPDYVAFQSEDNQASRIRRIPTCVKCSSMDGDLRNSLFDMRSFYGNLEWQNHSKDLGGFYAQTDETPYAPFAVGPSTTATTSTAPSVSCARCESMQNDPYRRSHRQNTKLWNPYSLRDSVGRSNCGSCFTRGIDCNCCFGWQRN